MELIDDFLALFSIIHSSEAHTPWLFLLISKNSYTDYDTELTENLS